MSNGYCEKHNQPWDIKCVNGQWICECPKCRADGVYDTYVTNCMEMLPEERWTLANGVKKCHEWARKNG